MIELCIKEYCHDCRDFEPIKSTLYKDGIGRTCTVCTVVECEHSDRCERLVKYVKEQMGKEKENEAN